MIVSSPLSSSLITSSPASARRASSTCTPLTVSFAPHITKRSYERVQDGSASIPSQGGHVLGLSWIIADESTVTLEEMEEKMTRRYPSSNKQQELKKITERQRLRLLFEQGVTLVSTNDAGWIVSDCIRLHMSCCVSCRIVLCYVVSCRVVCTTVKEKCLPYHITSTSRSPYAHRAIHTSIRVRFYV